MPLIDDVEFHLTEEQMNSEDMSDGFLVPMGMYIIWAATKNLLSKDCLEESGDFLTEVEQGELSARDVVDFEFDGKLFEYQFTPQGLAFTKYYYMTDSYFNDLTSEFPEVCDVYAIPDTKEALGRVLNVLSSRYSEYDLKLHR